MNPAHIHHATLSAHWSAGRWRGVLIRGRSGAGKSTLALRLLDMGYRLVADDRVVVWRSGDRVFGKPPLPLAGLIEVRSLGVLPVGAPLAMAEIALVIDLQPTTERAPEPGSLEVAGIVLPHRILPEQDANLPFRLAAALAATQHGL